MILYQTPEHKHKWVDKSSAYGIEGKHRVYLGILFVCSCGKMEIDSGLTTRVLKSLIQITLNELPKRLLKNYLFDKANRIYEKETN